MGKIEEALECLDKSIKLNPKFSVAYKTKGNVLLPFQNLKPGMLQQSHRVESQIRTMLQ